MTSPLRFLQQYRSIEVPFAQGDAQHMQSRVTTCLVQLRKYFMMNWNAGTEQMADYAAVTGGVVTRGADTTAWLRQNAERIRTAAMGKGAPQDYSLALEWAVRSGKIANPNQTTIQNYCDEHLGIDCSGFVTNYLVAAGLQTYSASVVRNTGAVSYYQAARAVNDPRTVRQGDILVWMTNSGSVLSSPGHVAVVESYQPRSAVGGNMRVAEATGHPNANPRLLDSMYDVERILTAGGAGSPVMVLVVRRHGSSGSRVSVMRY